MASSDLGSVLKSKLQQMSTGIRYYGDYSQMVWCLYYHYCLPFYRFLKLNNDLKVLLVSDVCTEKAAASLAVRVGELWLGGYFSCHVWFINLAIFV